MSTKYFGKKDPLGQVLQIDGNNDYTITGVIKDVPDNSHFTFNMVRSYETLYTQDQNTMNNWFHIQFYMYLLLKDQERVKTLANKFPDIVDRYMGKQLKSIGGSLTFFLQPLTRIHLYSDLGGDIAPQSDISYVYIFTSIALLIIFLTIINFINLSTARSSIRANEIGVRKTFGSLRKNIIYQFIIESIFLSLISLLLAGILFSVFLPFFQNTLGYKFNITLTDSPWIVSGAILLAIVTGLLSGFYPALYLSSLNPIYILRNQQITSIKGTKLRNFLVFIQLVITVVMIIGTISIFSQIEYMKNKNLGFTKENIIIIPGVQDILQNHSFTALQHEFSNIPGVIKTAGANLMPGTGIQKGLILPEGVADNKNQLVEFLYVDPHYIPTMGINLKEGRNFSPKYSLDPKNSVIINEAVVRKFGWNHPIGKKFIFESDQGSVAKKTYRKVIGVINDFHSASLHQKIEPLIIFYNTDRINYLAVRVSSENIDKTLKSLESKWKEFSADKTFRSFFLYGIFGRLYTNEEKLGQLVLSFSILTILIGCMGLFGLIHLMVIQQKKIVGIRKVYGASIKDIVTMYILKNIKFVFLANVFAWPITYYLTNKWLQNFAYQANFSILPFISALLLTLVITLVTISWQTIRAATTNPIDVLRYE